MTQASDQYAAFFPPATAESEDQDQMPIYIPYEARQWIRMNLGETGSLVAESVADRTASGDLRICRNGS
jgi:hypothetical protein